MSRRGSAKPPLVIDVRSYSDKDAKTTYLVETSYEQANTTARGAAAVEQRFSAFQDLHAAITEALNLGAFPVARVWYATDAVKKERVDRLHEYLAVVAEKAGATPPAELLAFLGVDAASFALTQNVGLPLCRVAVGSQPLMRARHRLDGAAQLFWRHARRV